MTPGRPSSPYLLTGIVLLGVGLFLAVQAAEAAQSGPPQPGLVLGTGLAAAAFLLGGAFTTWKADGPAGRSASR